MGKIGYGAEFEGALRGRLDAAIADPSAGGVLPLWKLSLRILGDVAGPRLRRVYTGVSMEDVQQEFYLYLLEMLPKQRAPVHSPVGWVWVVASHFVEDVCRGSAREARGLSSLRESVAGAAAPSNGAGELPLNVDPEVWVAIREGLAGVSGRVRAAWVLRRVGGMSYEAILEMLGDGAGWRNANAVKSAVSRCNRVVIAALRKSLGDAKIKEILTGG